MLGSLCTGGNALLLRWTSGRLSGGIIAAFLRTVCICTVARGAPIVWVSGAAQSRFGELFLWLLRLFKIFLYRGEEGY